VFRGKDVEEISELKQEGLSIRAISQLTGYSRRTIGKYLLAADRPASLRTETGGNEQTGTIQALSEGPVAGRCVERPGATARTSGT
jgi:hypothetical protein